MGSPQSMICKKAWADAKGFEKRGYGVVFMYKNDFVFHFIGTIFNLQTSTNYLSEYLLQKSVNFNSLLETPQLGGFCVAHKSRNNTK